MKNFTDQASSILKWSKFIIINFMILAIIIVVIALMLPDKYKATAVVMTPPESSLSGLSSLLGGGKSSAGVGAKLFGLGGSTSEDMILGVLNSRSILEKTINKFNLIEYYKVKNKSIENTIKAFKEDLFLAPNEYSMIEINVLNENPKISANIANYLVNLVDSTIISLNIQAAKNNKGFIEKRYLEGLANVKESEDSLYYFQKKYGVYSIEDQLEGSIKYSAEIESQIIGLELIAKSIEQTQGSNSPEYISAIEKIDFLKSKLNQVQSSGSSSGESIFVPFKKVPNISRDYLRVYRGLETNKAILEVLLPMYEQAKIEAQKSIPTILIVDKAVAPREKSEPRRSLIVVGFSFLVLILLFFLVILFDNFANYQSTQNEFQLKLTSISQRVKKFYRIK